MGENKTFQNIVASCLLTTASHPFAFIKTLTQLGHEPLKPYYKRRLFSGVYTLVYPGPVSYLSYVKGIDGFFGVYRGLKFSLISTALQKVTHDYTNQQLEEYLSARSYASDEISNYEELVAETKSTGVQIASRSAAIIVCHPFTVMSVRCMAQFVGRETFYNSVSGSIREIYKEDGILGFFSGIAPRLISDALAVAGCNVLLYIWRKYREKIEESSLAVTKMLLDMVLTNFTYPFSLTSNIMCVNSERLLVCYGRFNPCHKSWIDCFSYLYQKGQLKRGSKIIFRDVLVDN